MASWDSACPVEGQCSECGLEFAWREVLVDYERTNPRHVEHCPRRAIPFAAVRTLLWCILPWVFWKRVELKHEPRVGRMLLWLTMLLIGMHIASSAMLAIALWRVDLPTAERMNVQRQNFIDRIARTEEAITQGRLQRDEGWKKQAERDLAWYFPAVNEAIQIRHLLKAIGYPLVFIENGSDPLVAQRSPGWRSATSPGWHMTILRFWSNATVMFAIGMSIGFGVVLVVLPATRRKLRVRPKHLARAFIFGLAWFVPIQALTTISSITYVLLDLTGDDPSVASGILRSDTLTLDWPLWSIVFGTWIAIWWYCALRQGLRFPRPTFHWLIMLVVAVLLGTLGSFTAVESAEVERLWNPDSWIGEDYGRPLPQRLAGGSVRPWR